MKNFKVGLVGLGYWGKKHLNELIKLKNFEICGVADINPNTESYLREKFPLIPYFSSYKDLIELNDLDGVIITTSNETHYEIGKYALEKGKHVFVEKPITVKLSEAKELINIAERLNLVLAVGHIYRFNNAIKTTKLLIEEGTIGKIVQVNCRWSDFTLQSPNRDILIDLLPHIYDIMHYLTNQWPKVSACIAEKYRRPKLEEVGIITGYLGDAVFVINLSWISGPKTRTIEICGTKGSILVEAVKQKINLFKNNKIHEIPVEENNTIKDELLSFAETVKDGRTNFINHGSIGYKALAVIQSTYDKIIKPQANYNLTVS